MSELFQESGCSRRNWSGGPPETSNCYCHPGKAGGTPWDFSYRHPLGAGSRPHAVSARFSPSFSSTALRIRNFCAFPVTVIGNSSTNST